MAKNKDSELAAPSSAPTALTPAPSYIKTGNTGLEHLRAQDQAWPRVKLVQKTSAEVDERTAQPGDVLNDLTKEKYIDGDGELDFVPVLHFLSWLEWSTEDGGGLIAASMDPKSELAMRCNKGDLNAKGKLAVTEVHNFLSLLPTKTDLDGNPQLVILQFSKTSYKSGKRLLTLARMRGGVDGRPIYSGRYVLSTKKQTKGSNSWFEFTVDQALTDGGWASQDLYTMAEKGYASLKAAVEVLDVTKIAGADEAPEVEDGEKGKSDKF